MLGVLTLRNFQISPLLGHLTLRKFEFSPLLGTLTLRNFEFFSVLRTLTLINFELFLMLRTLSEWRGETFGEDFGRNPHITHKSNIQNILEYIQRVDYSY